MTPTEAITQIETALLKLGINPEGNFAPKDAYYMAVQLGYDIRWQDLPQCVVTIPQLAEILTDLEANYRFIPGDERHRRKYTPKLMPVAKKREAHECDMTHTCMGMEPRDLVFLMVITPGENERRLVAAILSEKLGPLL